MTLSRSMSAPGRTGRGPSKQVSGFGAKATCVGAGILPISVAVDAGCLRCSQLLPIPDSSDLRYRAFFAAAKFNIDVGGVNARIRPFD